MHEIYNNYETVVLLESTVCKTLRSTDTQPKWAVPDSGLESDISALVHVSFKCRSSFHFITVCNSAFKTPSHANKKINSSIGKIGLIMHKKCTYLIEI